MNEHRIDPETDECMCGGLVVYFEDGDDNGQPGYGCEANGKVFKNQHQRLTGRRNGPCSMGCTH